MYRKLSLFLFVFVLMFSTILGGNAVKATSTDEGFSISNPEVQKVSHKELLKIDNQGRVSTFSSINSQELFDLAKQSNLEHKSTNIYNNKEVNSESLDINKNSKTNTIEKQSSKYSYAEVGYDTIFDSTKKTITLKATITKLVGTRPSIIIANHNLHNSKTLEGTYSKTNSFTVEWTNSEIYVGKSYSKSFNVTSTNFWITRNVTTAGWLGSYPVTSTGQIDPVLANKKASIYPTIFNEHNGQYMPVPTKANMAVVPNANVVPWNNTLRGKYISAYIDKYGDPKWNWADADIHHVVPREYGGGNSFNNLYPLPRTMHQQIVTPWWASY